MGLSLFLHLWWFGQFHLPESAQRRPEVKKNNRPEFEFTLENHDFMLVPEKSIYQISS